MPVMMWYLTNTSSYITYKLLLPPNTSKHNYLNEYKDLGACGFFKRLHILMVYSDFNMQLIYFFT